MGSIEYYGRVDKTISYIPIAAQPERLNPEDDVKCFFCKEKDAQKEIGDFVACGSCYKKAESLIVCDSLNSVETQREESEEVSPPIKVTVTMTDQNDRSQK